MLSCYEERSACAFVPYLSHGTLVRLEIWLRGLATSYTARAVRSRCLTFGGGVFGEAIFQSSGIDSPSLLNNDGG